MIYVVWQKVNGNKEFRDLLLSVPDEAIIIEDTTFQKVHKPNDTPVFWGARNQERGEYFKMVKKYAELTKLSPVKAERNRYILQSFNNFTDYGVFRGCNVMGKILTLCRMCWKLRIEPPIDYDLLRAKNIYLLGKKLEFPGVKDATRTHEPSTLKKETKNPFQYPGSHCFFSLFLLTLCQRYLWSGFLSRPKD